MCLRVSVYVCVCVCVCKPHVPIEVGASGQVKSTWASGVVRSPEAEAVKDRDTIR
jgi:hypothetical protein